MNPARRLAWLCACAVLALPASGRGQTPPRAVFALILGVNHGADTELAPLRYADDDAVGYHYLFQALGARTFVLTRMDDSTRRLYPNLVDDLRPPRQAELRQVVNQLRVEVQQARQQQRAPVLYFIYAGHGNARGGRGYILLEDGKLTGKQILSEVVDAVAAEQAHLIVDACYSSLLAFERGPGGRRRPIHGFSEIEGLAQRKEIGLFFSTSSARESHE